MRTINLIVVHCSATREDKSFTEHDLDVCHRRRGFNGVGYHFYIRKNGDIILTLLKDFTGCRVCGHRDLSPDLDGDGEIEPEEWIKACPCFNAEMDWDKE